MAIFRAPDLDTSGVLLRAMAGQGVGSGTLSLRASLFVLGIGAALLLTWIASRDKWTTPVRIRVPHPGPVGIGAAASLAIVIASVALPAGSDSFIYFQF
jgi:hypothetical protein